MDISIRTLVIKDFHDRNEIIHALSCMETDEDFNGNNGKDYTRPVALEHGFECTQDYIIDMLQKSVFEGYDLINAFLDNWLGVDNYYDGYDFTTTMVGTTTVISIAFVHND